MVWAPGDVIVERQVWRGVVVAGFPTIVIEANDDHVVTYIAPGAPFGFVDGSYPGPGGRHPCHGRAGWEGHGMLSAIPMNGLVSVQHYWHGDDRRFACWYLNLQEPVRPTPIGFDSQDLELDIVIASDGSWSMKDHDLLDQRVREGRWTPDEAVAIRDLGARTVRDVIEPGRWWWDTRWSRWAPEPGIAAPRLPEGWAEVEVPPYSGILGS